MPPQGPAGKLHVVTAARYSALMGKRVDVQYRAGDIYLPATAILVADSGRSIFLEEHIHQDGRMKAFRWEIPYISVILISECSPALPAPSPPRGLAEPSAPASAGILGLDKQPSEA